MSGSEKETKSGSSSSRGRCDSGYHALLELKSNQRIKPDPDDVLFLIFWLRKYGSHNWVMTIRGSHLKTGQ